MSKFRVLALGALLVLAGQASAAPLADPEGTLVEELVVQAIEPGPAWWRVRDADTTVYILGVPGSPIPADVAWNRSVLARRVKGANVVVGGTAMTAGLRDLPALLRMRKKLVSKTPMEDGLAPALRARFVAERERLGKPASRYAKWQPVVAGQLLLGDAVGEKGAVSVESAVRKLAKADKVPIRSSSTYALVPFLQAAFAGLTPQIQADCLAGALDDAEAGKAPVRRAAEGWARGDTATALTAPRSFDRCLLLLSGGAALWKNATRDNANDIAKALETPGHAVAVVNLRRLLAEDGVIAQLEARGLKVAGPGEALE